MKIEFDPAKNEKNLRDRGLSFERTAEFDFENAIFLVDDRHDYGEMRHIAIGYLDGCLYVICFVETAEGIRIIIFRKANAREAKKYGKSQTID